MSLPLVAINHRETVTAPGELALSQGLSICLALIFQPREMDVKPSEVPAIPHEAAGWQVPALISLLGRQTERPTEYYPKDAREIQTGKG